MSTLEIASFPLIIASVFFYFMSFLFTMIKRTRISNAAFVIAWILNGCLFIIKWIINGYAPMASMYQVLTLLSLCFLPLYYLFLFLNNQSNWLLPYFQMASIVPIFGTLFMDRNIKWALVPALQSGWFVPHVFTYMLSYALAAVVFLITIKYIAGGQKLVDTEHSIHSLLRIAFSFMTIGLLFGALWAEEVWGAFWSWDIKEIWSLIMWLLFLCYFHARRVKKYKKISPWFIILAFIALIITFLFLNILPKMPNSLHTYTS